MSLESEIEWSMSNDWPQCKETGRFVEVLGNKFFVTKVAQLFREFLGYVENITSKLKLLWLLAGKQLGYLFQHKQSMLKNFFDGFPQN